MIEMPLNQVTPSDAPAPVSSDAAGDSPQGAFAEMLSRNLGHRLVETVLYRSIRSQKYVVTLRKRVAWNFVRG